MHQPQAEILKHTKSVNERNLCCAYTSVPCICDERSATRVKERNAEWQRIKVHLHLGVTNPCRRNPGLLVLVFWEGVSLHDSGGAVDREGNSERQHVPYAEGRNRLVECFTNVTLYTHEIKKNNKHN